MSDIDRDEVIVREQEVPSRGFRDETGLGKDQTKGMPLAVG